MASRYSLGELAQHTGSEVQGDERCIITGIATLKEADSDRISFLANPKYRDDYLATAAGAVIVAPNAVSDCPTNALVNSNPYATWARVAQLFAPQPYGPAEIHDAAVVANDAKIGSDVGIAATAVILPGCEIADDCWIGPGSVVGPNAKIGAGSRLVAQVHVGRNVMIGQRALLHPGVVIGADGFGHAPDKGQWVKVPQLGAVVVGNDVEIGANTTVDCGAIDDTVIGDGCKLDNQIQIGHNVKVGAHTVMAGQVAVAGSTEIGPGCVIGGRAGFAGHLKIAGGCMIAGGAAITKDIDAPGVFSSMWPAEPDRIWRRRVARFRQLDGFATRLKQLEKKLGDE